MAHEIVLLALLGAAALVVVTCVAVAAAGRPNAHVYIYSASAACCALILAGAFAGLFSPTPSSVNLPLGLPWIGAHFRVDSLSAVFLAVVSLGGIGASIFGIGYGRHERAPRRVLPFYPAFLAAMTLVILADDAFSFLLSWEAMSLLSWALVVSHDKSPENLRAGLIYIVMAGIGTMTILLAFGVMAGANGLYSFDAMRAHGFAGNMVVTVTLLMMAGAGSKAGLFPLHAWLPLAHPAAPSHVSALMSGVMTKVAVYAFIRVTFDLLGPSDWRLSMVVIAIGGATALLGVLYALMQHDLKRLLAYHTVENIGIIFVGLGLAMAFRCNGYHAAAALAVTAALFHVFNHSLFKSLLFFGTGAVQASTGERDMDHLGGLIRTMPATAAAFLIGAAAISALPPLNGFASEWMTFQAILLSPLLPQWGLRFLVPVAGAMLALSAALAAACFVKAFGITFLGNARSSAATTSRETSKVALAAMFGLAAGCVVAGIFPGLFGNLLGPAAQFLTSARMPSAMPGLILVPVAESHNTFSAPVVAACLLAATALTVLVIRLVGGGSLRRAPAWDCGFPDDNPAAQYTASSFAQPIRKTFATLVFQARERVVMPEPGDTAPARFAVELHDPAWEWLYAPVSKSVGFAAEHLNFLQFLTIRRYLGIVFLCLVLLLAVLALWE
jgi:formate hydrogenlyase subunit 3/multisubunit Na+/H+ antiporter MnhD subunit